ncbi:MAG TPA: 4-alpha-glucanotransferase [Longimicrobiales bacterium]
MPVRTDPLRRLARAHGVMTRYTDAAGNQQLASDDSLRAVLGLLGAEVSGELDASDALRELRIERARRALPQTLVAWEGRPFALTLRTPSGRTPPFRLELRLGNGDARRIDLRERDALGRMDEAVDGVAVTTWRFRVEERLPAGYHRIADPDGGADTLLLVAPERVHEGGPAIAGRRAWGVFLPVYAMRRAGDAKPMGDFDDLAALIDWVGARGGHVVGTLPLLAATPNEPSPYSPVSRLFWSEAFLGGDGAGDRGRPEAGSWKLEADYQVAFAGVRERLERELAEVWRDEEPEVVRSFRRVRPDVDEYARFRATWEARGESWWVWPDRLQARDLRAGDYDENAYRYHVYAQARVHERLAELAAATRDNGAGLYLDLPLGVHPDGYDVWRYRDRFAIGASVGAPPDPFFTRGQDWGFLPLHPRRMRESGLEYTIAAVRNHLRYAGVLRLDHVMGLHRLFWIPNGMEPADGVYVRYPAREHYAVLSIESHRAGAAIVGENLGTVPPNVNDGMRRHGVRGMHVVQFDVGPDNRPMVRDPEPGCVSSLNTHDMPTFTAFWTGQDLRQRIEWKLLDEEGAAPEAKTRARIRGQAVRELGVDAADPAGTDAASSAMRRWLERLAASDAALLLVNLEDLWGELQPQNVPGTTSDVPNWRRRARLALEELDASRAVTDTLETIDRLRRKRAEP